MKRIYLLLLFFVLFLFTSACHKPQEGIKDLGDTIVAQSVIDEQPPINLVNENADILEQPSSFSATIYSDDTPQDYTAVGGWGGDVIDYRYIGSMNDLGFIDKIVGSKAIDKFVEEYLIPSGQLKNEYTPYVYSAIVYFNIPEETFREYNNMVIEFNKQHGTAGLCYSDNEISALYCGDEAEMLRRLKSPYAFFDGKKVYNVYELVDMDAGKLVEASIPLDELSDYCDWLQGEMVTDRIPEYVDIEWFGEAFDILRQEISTAATTQPPVEERI